MSVIDTQGQKVVLPRVGPDEFWERILEHYAAEHPRRWRNLAMFALHESAGWPLERIARAFGHAKGHVARCLERVREEIRERFEPSAECGTRNAEWEEGES